MNTQNYVVNIRVGLANPARVNISQGDTGRTLAFSLYDGLSPFTPPTGSTVTIVGRKPSKLGFSEACTVSGNVATVTTTLAMTQEAGKFPVELRIEANGESIGTANFTMYIEPSPHPDGTTDGTHATVDNLQTQIGNLANLATTAKTNLVSAINEAAQSGGVVIDDTLTQTGQAADAKKTGDEIGTIKAEINEVRTTGGVNIFNIEEVQASGITRNGESLIGTARSFHLAYNSTSIPVDGEAGKRYTISLSAISNGADSTTGSGIEIKFKYSDNTSERAVLISNSTTTAQVFTANTTASKQLVGLLATYGSGANNVWTLSNIKVEIYPGLSDYEPYYTGYDGYARKKILTIRDTLGVVKTKNLFDEEWLLEPQGWTKNGDEYSGTAQAMYDQYKTTSEPFPFVSFKANTRYTFSLMAKVTGTVTNSSCFRFYVKYTDNTTSSYCSVPNTTSVWTYFSATTAESKTINSVYVSYGDGLANILYLKHVQLEEGNTATDYVPHWTAVDYIARQSIDKIPYNIPDYWDSALSTALEKIKTNEYTIGQNLVEFFFITDVHWNTNARHSGELLGYLADKSEIKTVINGGDLYNGEEVSTADAYDVLWSVCGAFNKQSFSMHTTCGNHDNNSPSDYLLTKSQLYSALHRRNESNETILNGGSVSYFDNINQKVRFIQLRAVWYITAEDRQIAETLINELDSNWTVVVYSHMYWTSYDTNNDPVINEDMLNAGQWLSALKESASAKIACWIVGHMHTDFNITIGNLLVIATTTDCITQSSYSGYTMMLHTDTEQAFDCYQIDTENKVIHITRIGAGNDRRFSYT